MKKLLILGALIALSACQAPTGNMVIRERGDDVEQSQWFYITDHVSYARGTDGIYALMSPAFPAGAVGGASVGSGPCWIRVDPPAPRTRCYYRVPYYKAGEQPRFQAY